MEKYTNPLLEVIHSHRSIREYEDKAVSQEQLDLIFQAASRASSSGNMQTYSIICTKNKELKKKLYPLHFNQDIVLKAPVVVTFCADFRRMKQWLELSDASFNFDNFMSFMIAGIDATLASQNAVLAAESLGLGVCYMGTTLANCEEIGKLLKLPENVVPVVGFTLGHPAESPEVRDRLPMNAIIHHETYQEREDLEILDYYLEKETAGMKRYKESPELKKVIEKVGAKNLAQVYTKAKYTRESHLNYSQNVLSYLETQNFSKLS